MNRHIGRYIRRLRKNRGLKTRDSSVGIADLREEWGKCFAGLIYRRLNYTSIARQILEVQEMPEGMFKVDYSRNSPAIVWDEKGNF